MVFADNVVLTAAFNLRDRTTEVTLADGTSVQASVRAIDIDHGLALLKADTHDAPAAQWAGAGPELSQTVVVGGRTPDGDRVTCGMVSSAQRWMRQHRGSRGPRGLSGSPVFEHTAPVGRGSAGAPVLDLDGRIVGINLRRGGDAFGLAVPATEQLRRRVDRLSRGESLARPSLGVALVPPHVATRMRAAVGLEPQDGILVREVTAASPADRAGIRQGDLLIQAGGSSLATLDDLAAVLDAVDVDEVLNVTVVRGIEQRDVEVHFASTQSFDAADETPET